ncbi:MAG: hypothetical protein U0U67_07365 [Chitinophagales bacterium]
MIALIAMIIFAVSCKKEKQTDVICKLSALKMGDDSTHISYNTSNKVSSIKAITVDDEINMNFVNEGIFHKQTITENGSTTPAYTIYYSLNTNGYIDRYQLTVTNAASVYVNYFRCKYDAEGHLILQEIKVTKSGFPFSYKKDSCVYESGNLTRLYRFRSLVGDTITAPLYSTTLVNYTTQQNTAGLYINQLLAPSGVEGTSIFYLANFPYISHLYGKGSRNLPLNSTTTFSSGTSGYSLNYEYTTSNNLVRSQTINRTPTAAGFPKINKFYYECN